MLNRAEQVALERLNVEIAKLDLPVALERRGDAVVVHLHAPVDAAAEARLLFVCTYWAKCCQLDPLQGPALPPAMFRQRHDAWVAEHPVTRKPTSERN